MTPPSTRIALTALRVGTATIMIVHGIARARLGIVDDFGVYLNQTGFPAGFYLAWFITITEIVGGLSIAAGYFVRPLAAWFILQLAMGIDLIHGRVGWFVVGAGRNGMEFSALLILCFAVIAATATTSSQLAAANSGVTRGD